MATTQPRTGASRSQAARITDVAAMAKVSIGTVSHVLNHPERVSTSTRQRVEKAIAELRFIPNPAARQLRKPERHPSSADSP